MRSRLLQDFLYLFYPELCAACERPLLKHEQHICLDCRLNLPKTDFHKEAGNPVERIFWGRVPIYSAGAFVYFQKDNKVQRLMHQIKYKGKKEIAHTLGKWYGAELKKNERFASADFIVPVPLHSSKLKRRGFNQSEWFARGIAESTGIAVNTNIIHRTRKSETQTRKTRFKRWENVSDIFSVSDAALIKNRQLILADDVITTGATLEACMQTILLAEPSAKLSIATLAFAS